MIRHYLTFARQAAVLNELLAGRVLAECWSQEKNQLLFRFMRGTESVFVEVSVDLKLGYALLKRDAARARRNTIDFFNAALGKHLEAVLIDDGERIIRFHLADGSSFALFFFGGGSGNILLLDGARVVDSFQKYEGEYDELLAAEPHHELRSREEILTTLHTSNDPPLRTLMRTIPELGQRLAAEALTRAGVENATSSSDLDDVVMKGLLNHVDQLYAECESGTHVYLYHLLEDTVFALTELQHLAAKADRIEVIEDIARGVHAYRSTSHRVQRFASLQTRMLKRLDSEHVRLERSLSRKMDTSESETRANEWERNAKLLLANLHQFERGYSRVKLTDWEGEEREISLDPQLTPVENVERYFRRARGVRDSAERTVERRREQQQALDDITNLAERVQQTSVLGQLEAIEVEHKGLFRMTGKAKEQGTAERFRRFEVVGGFEVYVGKNANNNDELTVRFARANDYWFHARGSSGSHVVLRWNDAKTKPPKEAIRAAASIAAHYSGARNAKMVPVAYTLKKYVRKPKGSAVGAVVMDREEVVMVEPKLPDGESV